MSLLHKCKQDDPDQPEYLFHCPGCGCSRWFKTTGEKPRWEFDGNMEEPTVTPSIRVRYGDNQCCHFFLTKRQIVYCEDCTHDLGGATVPMEHL